MPWHPPCALSNLIVTNLSSCQRIAFAIFDSFFLLRPTAKLFAFLRAYSVSRVSQLVSLQDVFPSGCAVFKVHSDIFRSLKTIQVQEEEQSFDQALLGFSFCFALSCSYTVSCVSTWNERISFLLRSLPRKEVIQPHLPIRLPCYDFTPVIGLTFDGWLLSVTSPASGAPNSHGVTGGVYKARERIHRGMLIRDY